MISFGNKGNKENRTNDFQITLEYNISHSIRVEGLDADKQKVDSVSYVNYLSGEQKVFSYLESKEYSSPLISHFVNCEKRNEAYNHPDSKVTMVRSNLHYLTLMHIY